MISKDSLMLFVATMKADLSVNFPVIARKVGLDWFNDIEPIVDTYPGLRTMLERAIQEIKFELYDSLLTVGRSGKKAKGYTPEASYIRAFVQAVDSGEILKRKESGANDAPDAAKLAEHRKRLGLGD